MIEIWVNSARFHTSQHLADQAKMLFKKSWFCDHEIQEINREEYQQDSLTQKFAYKLLCINWIWDWITFNGWYAIKPNQTKSYI